MDLCQSGNHRRKRGSIFIVWPRRRCQVASYFNNSSAGFFHVFKAHSFLKRHTGENAVHLGTRIHAYTYVYVNMYIIIYIYTWICKLIYIYIIPCDIPKPKGSKWSSLRPEKLDHPSCRFYGDFQVATPLVVKKMTCSKCCSDHLPTVTMIFTARLWLYWATHLVSLFCGRDFETDVAESSKHLWGHEVQTQGVHGNHPFCWIQGLLVECGLDPTSDFRVIISWISPCRFQIDLHRFGWTLSDLTIPDPCPNCRHKHQLRCETSARTAATPVKRPRPNA
jgi:hypothetical protein